MIITVVFGPCSLAFYLITDLLLHMIVIAALKVSNSVMFPHLVRSPDDDDFSSSCLSSTRRDNDGGSATTVGKQEESFESSFPYVLEVELVSPVDAEGVEEGKKVDIQRVSALSANW